MPDALLEREMDEEVVPELSCRVQGTASFPNLMRSGVVAHDVGYRKTICMLALLDHQQDMTRSRNSLNISSICMCVYIQDYRFFPRRVERVCLLQQSSLLLLERLFASIISLPPTLPMARASGCSLRDQTPPPSTSITS